MSTVAELQAAVERLPVADRIALYHWLSQDEAVLAAELTALRAAVDAGDRDLAEGRYTVLESDDDFQALATDIKQSARSRLGKSA